MIELKNLTKRYRKRRVLCIDNFCFEDGKIYGIIGNNGSGKSTLMKCLVNLVDYDGDILYNKINLKSSTEVIKDVGVLIETPSFYNDKTAVQNLDYFLGSEKDYASIMSRLGLHDFMYDKVKTYSMGMRQKLAIALACLKGNKVILLDEPFNGLDMESVNVLIKLLISEKRKGKTIIVSSHIPNTIYKLCDEIYRMQNGKLNRAFNNNCNRYVIFFNSLEDADNAYKTLSNNNSWSVTCLGYELTIECDNNIEVKDICEKLEGYKIKSIERNIVNEEVNCND